VNLTQFAGLLEKMAVPAAAVAALDTAARSIEVEAKSEIGTYQRDNMGPFAPWEELKQATQRERERLGFTPNDPLLRTGDLRDSISHETHGLEAVVGSTSQVMVWQELGTETIPPRSVLGLAAQRRERQVVKLIGAAVMSELMGDSITRLHAGQTALLSTPYERP